MPSWKKVILSGSDASLNSLYVNGPITGSDVKINDWGSISASLASIESGVATQTLQDVTDNGNTTTNSIAVTGFTSSITGGDGITGTFRSTNGYNRLFLISTGSSGTNFGQVNIVLRDSSGASNNDGTISYGGGQSANFSLKTSTDNEIRLFGSSTSHNFSFSQGDTGSLYWNAGTVFIQRTSTGQTQFLGLATSASYVATASYTPTLQQVTTQGSTTTNNITVNALTVSTSATITANAIITGSIRNYNSGYESYTYTSGNSISNGTTNGTLINIDTNSFESITMDYVVFNSTRSNKRAGTLRGTWDNDSSAVVFDETATTDIGDTSAFTLDISNNGSGTATVRVTNNVGVPMTIIYDYKLLG